MKTKIFGLLVVLLSLALVTGCTPITDTPEVPEETTYTVTYSSEYGTAPEPITVPENTVLSVEQLPELSTEGKTFGGWFDGDTKAEAGTYKVTKNVTLTAKWNENTPASYSITISSEIEHGSISIQGNKTTAAKGETITLTVTPNDGYELEEITVNGDKITGNTFDMPESNVTVDASFKETAETISQKAVDAVIAKINKIGTVEYTSESKTLIDAARAAYDALTNEQKALVTNYSTLTTAELTYASLIPYTIVINAITNGTVSTDKTSVKAGEIITLTVTPDNGYELDTLSVKNGDTEITVTQDSSDATKYTFTMPAGNVTVSAPFKTIDTIPAGTTIKLLFDDEPGDLHAYDQLPTTHTFINKDNGSVIANELRLDDIKFYGETGIYYEFSNNHNSMSEYYSLNRDEITIYGNLVILKYYYQEENN